MCEGVDLIVNFIKKYELPLHCPTHVRAWLYLTGRTELEWIDFSMEKCQNDQVRQSMQAEFDSITSGSSG